MNGKLIVAVVFLVLASVMAVLAIVGRRTRPVAVRAWWRAALLFGLVGTLSAVSYYFRWEFRPWRP